MFPGFNRRKKGSISNGDWDRDGVKNLKDCDALNWKRQDGGEVLQDIMNEEKDLKRAIEINLKRIRETNDTEEKAHLEKINDRLSDRIASGRLEYHRQKNKRGTF